MSWPVLPHGFLGSQSVATGDNDTYQISRSLRFNSADSAYLSRTPASAGNLTTWTWSGWFKRSKLGVNQTLFSSGTSAITFIHIQADDTLRLRNSTLEYVTTQVFRDVSAWYHLVVRWETGNATAGDRVRVYINGSEINSFSTETHAGSNEQSEWNKAQSNQIGRYAFNGTLYFDGYLTEINFIDGQALTTSSFGETDAITGRWKAKAYSGTYGTNGFYLNFSDNSSLTTTSNVGIGKDFSGNGNYWATNGLSVTAGTGNDSLLDSPTNSGTSGNYCALNPLNKAPNRIALLNGNLDLSQDSSGNGNWNNCIATHGVTTGKWYWEVTPTSSGEHQYGVIGSEPTTSNIISDNTAFTWLKYTTNSCGYYSGGGIYNDNQSTVSTSVSSFASGDIVGIALDADSKTIQFYKNNSSQYTHTFSGNAIWLPAFSVARNSATCTFTVNFGQRPFAYTAPTGFKALCTTNLPTPTIRKPSSYMDVVTYTGNGTTQTISSLGFSPDLVWIKSRAVARSHRLLDTIRGVNSVLASDATGAEYSSGTPLSSFNSNGFSLTNSDDNVNSETYVAWAWDAGETSSTNTAGSITSTVRVNAQAGVSIVSWTDDTSTNNRVGHGLGVTPAVVLYKQRNTTGSWYWTTTKIDGSFDYLLLNQTSAKTDLGAPYTAPTSTTFSNFGGWGGASLIAYCFAEVEGFSKFGSYTGNGSADGPFVWCGFRPRWVMIKGVDVAESWKLFDSSRNPENEADLQLFPNLSAQENAGQLGSYRIDFISSGVKLRGNGFDINASGKTYIFAAFAESAFKYSRAR